MTDIKERHEEHCPACTGTDYVGRPCRGRDMVPRGDAIREADRADKAEAALAQAYTLLVSVQPCVARMVGNSPNAETLRLNRMLDAAIDVWVNDYLTAHEEATK